MEEREQQPPHGIGKGDSEAFAVIVRDNQRWLRGYFRARLSDWAAADDLAQDVFVTAFLKIRGFRGDSSVESWLHAIAHNHLRNHLRKHREQAIGGSEELQAMLDQSCDSWQGGTPPNKTMEALAACKERMPKAAIALLDMRYTQGKSVREISKETGKGYSAMTMKFHRLRELLAECITMELGKSGAGGAGRIGFAMEKPRGESA